LRRRVTAGYPYFAVLFLREREEVGVDLAAWVILEDTRWAIAFTASVAWVPAFVAASAGDPLTVEDLLATADFYRRGLAADVSDRFIAADRVRLGRQPSASAPHTVAEAPAGDQAALLASTAEDGQLHIVLPRHLIEASGPIAGLVRARGDLEVWEGGRGTGRYVVYQLPGHWTVRVAREAR
jgi:hypothetical protein